jgi:hypothetical protein
MPSAILAGWRPTMEGEVICSRGVQAHSRDAFMLAYMRDGQLMAAMELTVAVCWGTVTVPPMWPVRWNGARTRATSGRAGPVRHLP